MITISQTLYYVFCLYC
ncbi:hypothetical protein Nmel_011304 [Mimus melanotis]